MIDAQKLQEIQNDSYKLLVMAYCLSANRWREGWKLREVLDELDWDHKETSQLAEIIDFLQVRKFIKRLTLGDTFHVTHSGIVEIESRVLDDEVVLRYRDPESAEDRSIDLKDVVTERQMRRGEYLQEAFVAASESRLRAFRVRPIVEEMGISEEEAWGIEQYLSGAGWLKRKTMGLLDGSVQMTEWGMLELQRRLLYPEEQADGIKIVEARGPNQDTVYKINRLRELRAESIRAGTVGLGWINACELISIDPKTVMKHDPELRKRWNDPDYT